jgi:hypothetical protein
MTVKETSMHMQEKLGTARAIAYAVAVAIVVVLVLLRLIPRGH